METSAIEKAALVESVRGYIIRLARRYAGLAGGMDDLVAAGTAGAFEASLRFDPGRGNRFLTYAAHWIRARMLEELRFLTQHQGEQSPRLTYLEAREEEGRPEMDLAGPEADGVDGEGLVGFAQTATLARECLATLDERSQEILRRRYFSDAPVTFDEIGRSLSLSRERVRQIERAALQTLRRKLRRAGLAVDRVAA
jgi:RNA polymerase sigma factor (sigma-70 family)